jgi:glycosyltransferase involved in cell wall biosynthesis
MLSQSICIVIPAYNEAEVISDVIRACRTKYASVVVVDDCSTDTTGDRAFEAGATVIRHPLNLGQGAALQTGIQFALESGAELIVTFDADGQHRIEDVDVLLRHLDAERAEVALGSRFLGTTENMPWLRRKALKLAVGFTRLTTGLKLTDVHNGLRVLTRGAAARIRISQDRMAHASELLSQIRQLNIKIVEAPVTILYTEYSLKKGQSLSNAANILADLFVARLSK